MSNTTIELPEEILNDRLTRAAIAAHTPTTDWEAAFHARGKEIDNLNAVLAATRRNAAPLNHPEADLRPAVSAAQFEAKVGRVEFLNMTRAQKLSGIGLDPNSVDDGYLKKVFGRGSDGALGVELMKASPLRYRQLKNAAEVLRIYGT